MHDIATSCLVALSLLAAPSSSPAGDLETGPAGAAPTTIVVSFKLDPRLSGPTYGGERWVSPPTYSGAGAQSAVDARASTADAKGRPTRASLDWVASDPGLLTVTPARGEQVRITVKRVGEGTVLVTAGGATRKLVVKATERNGIRHVTIAQ